MSTHYSIADIKQAASGRELEVLIQVAGISPDLLDGRGHACPWCGGKDRFRLRYKQTGGVGCNQCFDKENADFIAAVCKARNIEIPLALHEIASYLGLETTPTNTKPKIVATYNYCDETGKLLFQSVRYEPKEFRQRQPAKQKNCWLWSVKDVRIIPYRLPELLAAKPEEIVFIAEGEKDCDNLAKLGLIATTNAAGAGKWKSEHAAFLQGKHVVILPDNDPVGHDHAQKVAQTLQGIAASIKIVELPNLPIKGDVSDWLQAGNNKAKLLELVASVPHWEPQPENVPLETATQQTWHEPQPLPTELPEVQAFDYAMLPEVFTPWVRDIAERIQCPPDFVAVAAMISLAGIVGRKIGIRPKARDNWLVVPNLWGVVIGRPGVMKTPAIMEPLKPLQRLEAEAKQRYEAANAEYLSACLVEEATKKARNEQIKKKALNDKPGALELARQSIIEQAEAPIPKRYLVKDTTAEKLGETLSQNPDGVTIERDEIAGLLRYLDDEKNASARAFYLEAWNGTNRYAHERIGRGITEMEAAIVSIIGGTQPSLLRDYMRDALRGGKTDDGLVQRFQLAVWPDVSREWINVDRWPDTQAKQDAYEVFTRLDALDPLAIGAEVEEQEPHCVPYLRFESKALELFVSWREQLEKRLRNNSELPPMESHLSKYRSLIPSLALLIHLADVGAGAVGLASLQKALRWSEYLESHARRIYDIASNPSKSALRALAHKLLDHSLEDGFTVRLLQRKHWTGLTDLEELKDAIEILVELHWLQEHEQLTAGRSKVTYSINPKIFELVTKSSANSDKSYKPADSQPPSGTFGTEFSNSNEKTTTPQAEDENEVIEWNLA